MPPPCALPTLNSWSAGWNRSSWTEVPPRWASSVPCMAAPRPGQPARSRSQTLSPASGESRRLQARTAGAPLTAQSGLHRRAPADQGHPGANRTLQGHVRRRGAMPGGHATFSRLRPARGRAGCRQR